MSKWCIRNCIVPQHIFITITHTDHIFTHSSLSSIHYITIHLYPRVTLIYVSHPWKTNVPSFGVMSTTVWLTIQLGYTCGVPQDMFIIRLQLCVPQDIFNTTTTHRSHNHTFTTTIYSFYHLTSTQCHPLLFVSSLDNKCTNFGVMSAPVDVACEGTYSMLGYDTSSREVQDHAFPEPLTELCISAVYPL